MSEPPVLRYSSDAEPCGDGFVWTSPPLGFGLRLAWHLAATGLLASLMFALGLWPVGTWWVGGVGIQMTEGGVVYRAVPVCIGVVAVLGIVTSIRGAFVPTTVKVRNNRLTHTQPGVLKRVASEKLDLRWAVKAVVVFDGDDKTHHVELRDASGYTLLRIGDAHGNEERLKLLADLLNAYLDRRTHGKVDPPLTGEISSARVSDGEPHGGGGICVRIVSPAAGRSTSAKGGRARSKGRRG